MDPRAELGAFLRTRRAQVDVADTPLAAGASLRRVPGLRREEVAELTLSFVNLEIPERPGIRITVYSAAGEPTAQRLAALAADVARSAGSAEPAG